MGRTSKRIRRVVSNVSLLLSGDLDLRRLQSESRTRYKTGSVSDFRKLVAERDCRIGLDLGCGAQPKNPFGIPDMTGVDLLGSREFRVEAVDLSSKPIPRLTGSVDFVSSFDFLEHVPRWERVGGEIRFPFIDLMDEIYRVLTIGGLFFSKTPGFPSPKAFQDPTHVNFITEATFPRYFCDSLAAKPYGFEGEFDLLKQVWEGGHLLTLMKKSG